MKTILASAMAIGLALAVAPALAADNDNDHHHGHHGQNDQNDNDHHDNDHNGNNHHGDGHNAHGGGGGLNVHVRITDRPDVVRIRGNIRAPHRFHWRVYARPHGWYRHHWVFRERLPAAFFVSDYWINDYGSFGLIAPPEGLVWVRVDNDALLIDRESGEIVRVVYNVFY